MSFDEAQSKQEKCSREDIVEESDEGAMDTFCEPVRIRS